MSVPGTIVYVAFWIIMIVLPIIAGIRRYWAAALIYGVGTLIFLGSLFRDRDGWADLANFATLFVVVLPIYLVGTTVWLWLARKRKSVS